MTEGQEIGKICSLNNKRSFVISRFFFTGFAFTGVNKLVHYTEDFVTERAHNGALFPGFGSGARKAPGDEAGGSIHHTLQNFMFPAYFLVKT